jgi:hypothetical protein
MSKEARQAIQYAEKRKSEVPSSKASAPIPHSAFTQDNSPFLMDTTLWKQDAGDEGVRMAQDPVASSTGDRLPTGPVPYTPASTESFAPRSYPLVDNSYSIPEPVPVQQFPRVKNMYNSSISESRDFRESTGVTGATGVTGVTGVSRPTDISYQLAQIQLELANLRADDNRASYAMEEFIICVGMGVGILLLLDKVST